eukprot:COSAG05_NODE_9895_length_595_cov_0.911290_1_plen_71_part_01
MEEISAQGPACCILFLLSILVCACSSGGKRDLHSNSVCEQQTKKTKTSSPPARSKDSVDVLLVGEGNFSYS